MTMAAEFFLERRRFVLSVSGFGLVALVVALTALAALSGQSSANRQARAQADFAAAVAADGAEWRAALVKIEAGGAADSPYDAQPMDISLAAILPPAPLADFSHGLAALYPTSTTLSAYRNGADLFAEYETANPTLLAAGRFDLVFLVTVLIPLLMIAASFDVLAGDRGAGRAQLAAAQGRVPGQSVWARLLVRNGVIGVTALLAMIASALLGAGVVSPERLSRLGLWLLVATAYFGFWHTVIAFAASVIRSSETVAATLAAAWVILVFAAPAAIGAAAQSIYPPPSRLALLSEIRAAKADATRNQEKLQKAYFADHPDLFVSDDQLPAYYTNVYLANLETEKRIAPILTEFDAARRQRAALVDGLQYLSPPLIAHRALSAIAGADADRPRQFAEQCRTALAELTNALAPAVLSRTRLSSANYEALQPFVFRDASSAEIARRLVLQLAFLVGLAFVFYIAASHRLRAPLEKLL